MEALKLDHLLPDQSAVVKIPKSGVDPVERFEEETKGGNALRLKVKLGKQTAQR